jgi:hypothetical protein
MERWRGPPWLFIGAALRIYTVAAGNVSRTSEKNDNLFIYYVIAGACAFVGILLLRLLWSVCKAWLNPYVDKKIVDSKLLRVPYSPRCRTNTACVCLHQW